ncbi:T9SS type A sorting domain-containing protein [bacterium]|nr:T9SS type A sorting domain-containing protein [bacterium]
MKSKLIALMVLIISSTLFAGDLTMSLSGVNPLTLNVKGTSDTQEAGGLSVYIYYNDDGSTVLETGNVNEVQLASTWGWGTGLRTMNIQTGSWSRGGHTFTRRLYYDNSAVFSADDYWTTGGINALVCTFTSVGSGHAYIEANTDGGNCDFSASEHTVSYANQDHSLPIELSSFSAEPMDQGVLVSWATESETDNLGFILERSSAPATVETHCNASPQWDRIASYSTHNNLRGQGNTSQHTEYTFTDNTTQPGQTYTYRLSDVNTSGDAHLYDEISITLEDAPEKTALEPPYPNPFNPETKINYQLAEAGPVEITIYNLLGQKIRNLIDQDQSVGSYNLYWHGDDASGSKVATGTYLVVLKTQQGVRTQKVVMLR